MPKVSLILPCYNVSNYINKSILCCISQSLKDIEIICVDDGSTDNTLSILKQYEAKDSRIRVLTQENQYVGVARNTGLSHAKGEYVLFLDPDDFYDLEMVNTLYEKAIKDETDITMCGYYQFHKTDIVYRAGISFKIYGYNLYQKVFSKKDLPNEILNFQPMPWNKIYKRSFLLQNSIQFQNVPFFDDVCFSLECLAKAEAISIIPDPLYFYNSNRLGNSTSMRDKNVQYLIEAFGHFKEKMHTHKDFSTIKSSLYTTQLYYALTSFLNIAPYYDEKYTFFYNYLQNHVKFLHKNYPNLLKQPSIHAIDAHSNMNYILHKVLNFSHKDFYQSEHSFKKFFKKQESLLYIYSYFLGIPYQKQTNPTIQRYLNDVIHISSSKKDDIFYLVTKNAHEIDKSYVEQLFSHSDKKNRSKSPIIVFSHPEQEMLFKHFFTKEYKAIILPIDTPIQNKVIKYFQENTAYKGYTFIIA